jgi:preprotein translocase subunit SecA
MMRGLDFAIVDEADSVLIDAARTPLILSGEQDSQIDEATAERALDFARRLPVQPPKPPPVMREPRFPPPGGRR